MTEETIKVPALTREIEVSDIQIRKETGKPTRITFSGSSTYRVERFFGDEILDHSASAIRLERAKRGALPLLFNHDMDDPVGMVDEVRVENERTVVEAHFFPTDRAREVEAMVDGGLRNVSTRYRIHRAEEQPKTNTTFVREWEPLEYSIVSIPADPTVGVGRTDGQEFEVRMLRASPDVSTPASTADRRAAMSEQDTAAAGASAERSNGAEAAAARIEAGKQQEQPNAVEMEKRRKGAIEKLCRMNNLDEKYRDHFIGQGLSLEQVADDILAIFEERGKTSPSPASKLGLTSRETKNFSMCRAINACIDKDWKDAGFELECSRAVAQKLGKVNAPTKFYVPFEVLEREVPIQKRDLTVATAGAGGFLVSTDNMGFVEMLRNRSVAFRMGARRLSGLQGNVTIPRQSAAATAVWLANEASTVTESQQTFVQIALTPKTVGAYTEVSRLLLLQSSPAAEGIVTDDLAQVTAVAADLGVLNGSGASGQPTGILGTAGIGSVTGTSLAAAGVIEFQTDVATSNVAPLRGGYVTTPAVAGLLMVRPELPSTGTTRLWQGNIWDGNLFNFPAMTSNQMPAATMLFGDWQEVVVAEWGVLEVEVNPYANFQAGIVGVRALYSMDVGVRRPFAFSSASSIT